MHTNSYTGPRVILTDHNTQGMVVTYLVSRKQAV